MQGDAEMQFVLCLRTTILAQYNNELLLAAILTLTGLLSRVV
jgi:hypothetical protein